MGVMGVGEGSVCLEGGGWGGGGGDKPKAEMNTL